MESGEKMRKRCEKVVEKAEYMERLKEDRAAVGSRRGRSSRAEDLPTRYVEVGSRVRFGGVEYECVEAAAESCPAAACSGCDFSRKRRGCWSLQCSPQDRRDGKFVWFREVEP